MKIQVFDNPEAVAKEAAKFIMTEAWSSVRQRGQFTMAVSGGRTPWLMLRDLAYEEIPWQKLHLFQTDERVAPDGHADRNLTHIQENLLQFAPLSSAQLHAMPVAAKDFQAMARDYSQTLQQTAGVLPVLDVVHLGLGSDGHTASLVPGDPVLNETDSDVALTDVYQGRRRMTLTYPLINRSRRILWIVTGSEKGEMLKRLCAADTSIPAGRVRQENALVLADRAAAGKL